MFYSTINTLFTLSESTGKQSSSSSNNNTSNNVNTTGNNNSNNSNSSNSTNSPITPPPTTMYSEYGYLQICKADLDSDKLQVSFENKERNMKGAISKKKLSKEIRVCLKTLYGDRKLHTFNISIDKKISVLVEMLIEAETEIEKNITNIENIENIENQNKIENQNIENNQNKIEKNSTDPTISNNIKNTPPHTNTIKKWDKNQQYRIISTQGCIRELHLGKTFIEENIKHGQILILAIPLKLHFNELLRGTGIILQNQQHTAFKQSGDELQYAICNQGFSFGKHYCEFSLEAEPDEKNIMIGITLARMDLYFSSECKGFWGYVPSECNKIFNNGNNVENVEYGDICKMGDKIGILMEFNDGGLDVSFYINNVSMGMAFKGLPKDTYYPCAILYYECAKVKVTNKVPLPM